MKCSIERVELLRLQQFKNYFKKTWILGLNNELWQKLLIWNFTRKQGTKNSDKQKSCLNWSIYRSPISKFWQIDLKVDMSIKVLCYLKPYVTCWKYFFSWWQVQIFVLFREIAIMKTQCFVWDSRTIVQWCFYFCFPIYVCIMVWRAKTSIHKWLANRWA